MVGYEKINLSGEYNIKGKHKLMQELTTLDYTNIIAIFVVILILFGLGRVLIKFTRSLFRIGCLIVVFGVGIIVLWQYIQLTP